MKKTYEKPIITQYHSGSANKFGNLTKMSSNDNIEGIAVKHLVEKYGSPLFVYSETTIAEKHSELLNAFSLRYPRVKLAWSYKTNYLKTICSIYHKLGSWAEVVSEMEYRMARNLGVEPSQIIFNGPYKPYNILKEAIRDGALINIDSMDELYDIEKIAAELGSVVEIGIRVNMSLGTYMSWDRFGFNIESGQAYQAVRRAVSGGKINIAGIHAHIGTFILEPDLYRIEVENIIAFARWIKEEFGTSIKYIDIGGGFASRNRLKGTYLYTGDMVLPFSNFADSICNQILSAFKPNELPTLFLETGRALIDEAGMLIATVVATKRLPSGIRTIVIDAGTNLLFTAFWYDHETIPTMDKGYAMEDHVIYGPLCMQIDVISPLVKLPALERGDTLIIKPVGAYNNTQWMQFINFRPNIVMIGENGDVSLIREAEDLEYLQKKERLPEWLMG